MTDIQNFVQKIARDPNLTKEEKVAIIKTIYTFEQNKLQKDLNKFITKKCIGAVIECISAGIPYTGVGKGAASVGIKSFEKIFGKKMSQPIADFVMRGLATGAVHGAGDAIAEDKPILENMAKHALISGTLLGTGTGVLATKTKNKAVEKLMRYENFASLEKPEKAAYLSDVNDFFREYERGKSIFRFDIGRIKIPSDQIKETSKQSPHLARYVTSLGKNLRTAKYIGSEAPIHDHSKYQITKFHRLRGKDADYIISENANNGKYFYKIAEPRPFTTEQIARMSPKEFSKNEALIMKQMRRGLIQSENKNIDFKNFKNPENGKNLIYTRQDIDKMSSDEFSKHEKAIYAQMRSIGIPPKNEVPKDITTFTKQQKADNPKPPKNDNPKSSKDGKWVTINGNHVLIDE